MAEPLPMPDKNIPTSVMLIGTFQIGIALWLLIILILVGRFDGPGFGFLLLLVIYGTLGAGLLAIEEWARFINVVLHVLVIPYTIYTLPIWDAQSLWKPAVQILISIAIIIALTRPKIRYKFQTVVAKQKG